MRIPKLRRLSLRWLVGVLLLGNIFTVPADAVAADDLRVFEIKPSDADPAITRFNDPNIVEFDSALSAQQELVVFLPGTGGQPRGGAQLYGVVAAQGYRVIGLEYNDYPAVVQVCPRNPSPACSGAVRQKRIFGTDTTNVVENSQAESIVDRLMNLLNYLDRHDPERQWRSYLIDSEPDWSRIVVSGLSQGAGMAAYIAKRKKVARVVLFSSPWDYDSQGLAPWISGPSATPPERWYAEYHRRENTAALIARAYRQLAIPPDNVRVFDLGLPSNTRTNSENPFHGSTIRNPAYADQWTFLFGHSP